MLARHAATRAETRVTSTSLFVLLAVVMAAGCSTAHPKLKPLPVIYGPGRVDLASLVPPDKRSNELEIFYATNRKSSGSGSKLKYNNGVDDGLRLGVATVRMGDEKTSWDEVAKASSGGGGNPQFRLARVTELARVEGDGEDSSGGPTTAAAPSDDEKAFYDAINRQLALSPNREVNIYVHGYATYFGWEVENLAKFFHCTGRRGAMVCFSWPCGQRIMRYGADVKRGRASAHHLADLVEMIAKNTDAEHINVLGYSAGAMVATEALMQVRDRHPQETPAQVAKRLRLGNVIYAASDVDMESFVRENLARLKEMAKQVIVYISDNDAALGMVSVAGGSRVGRPDGSKFTRAELEAMDDEQLQVIDVTNVPGPHSAGGFGGHGYWYANDRIMTDVLVSFRWQANAEARGLYREPGKRRWLLPDDYPDKITAAVLRLATPAATTSTATTRNAK